MPRAERSHRAPDNNRTHGTPGVCTLVARLSGLRLPGRGLETGAAGLVERPRPRARVPLHAGALGRGAGEGQLGPVAILGVGGERGTCAIG
jgi:hypothetical protein